MALAVLLAATPAAATTAAARDSIARLIPDGPVTAEVMTPDYSPRMQELSRKLLESAQRNPRWFEAYARTHARPLPWDPRLGLTRSEYLEYTLGSRVAPLAVGSRLVLNFVRAGRARCWTLHGWGKLEPLEGLVFDLDHDVVRSRQYGALPGAGISRPNDPSTMLDWRWYGVWRAIHQIGDPAHGGKAMLASFNIGPVGDGHMVGLYWTARRVNMSDALTDQFVLLRFKARQ